jgi:hypothetical protein
MDAVLNAFLNDTFERAGRLGDEFSARIYPDPSRVPPARYLVLFPDLEYLRLDAGDRTVRPERGPVPVEIRFPASYLRSTDPHMYLKIATLLDPSALGPPHSGFFHPNCDPASGAICLGSRFPAGARLDALVHHVYDIVTFQNYGTSEWDCLNPAAARYLRENPQAAASLNNPSLRSGRRRFTVRVS